jgi:exosome complex RNA-binding protein Csl4
VNPATNEITLKLSDNNIVTFKLASAASVIAADSTGNSLVALKPGDDVRLTLTGTQDLAASVAVRKTIVYRVSTIDLQNQQLLLETQTGATTTFSVPSSATIESSAQTGLTLSNIAADSMLSVTFTGNTIDKIRILDVVRGKVTGFDPAKGTLTLLTYQNNSQTFTVGTDAVYSQNSRLLAGLNALKTDDRVELVQDLSGKYYIAVAVADQRTVASYSAYNKQIVLKRVNIDDQTNYDFMDNAYIHQGTEVINPNFLYDPNEVRIYMIDGKIMELEKLN